jgi:uncharacterized membrane protein
MAYLTRLHYTGAPSAACDFSAELSCNIVNLSLYSELLGVPVAVFGLGYFLFVIGLFVSRRVKRPFTWTLLFSIFSLTFGLYLSGIEQFILGSICVFCEASKLLMIALIAVSAYGARAAKEPLRGTWIVAAVLAGVLFSAAAWALQSEPRASKDYSGVARCLSERGVVMYGAYWCPSCAKVKKGFGEAFAGIAYVECDPRGEDAQAARCIERAVRKTPTWIQEPGGTEVKREEGALSPEKLAETFGCEEALPAE